MHVNYLLTFEGKNAYLFGVSPTFLYFCRQIMRRHILLYIFLLPCLLMVGALCSCDGSYPQELTQADSLMLRGEYGQVDSLLAVYDRQPSSRKSVQMYRHLLQMGRLFVDEELTDSHFSMVDSLSRYYNHWYSPNEYAQSLCFLGEIYKVSGDNPSALDAFLKGVKVAKDCGNSYVQGWLCQQIGDVYFGQRMLDDCTNYYRRYYDIAVSNHDTLRMALAADRMGKVHTILNQIDSTIYYYRKAIDLAQHTAHPENIIPYSKYSLSDIYIQIEEYDKAKSLMPRDTMNDANWAYWHLSQNHTDSAIYYFKRFHSRYGLPAHRSAFHYLALLEESKGNTSKALSYYRALPNIEDSIRAQSQVEETRRVNAQFNVNLVKKERDEMTHRSNILQSILLFVILFVALGIAIGYYAWKYYRQKKDAELAHERLLRQEEEMMRRQSVSQIEENKRKIAELEQQLVEARQRNDVEAADRIMLDAELLTAENRNIEASQRRREFALKEFQKTDLYTRLKLHAGEEETHLSEAEWQQLAHYLDDIYDDFTHRLLSIASLSDTELRACYLLKLEVSPTVMAALLFKSKQAISMIRKRLYKKIIHREGTPKQFDEFIVNF